MTVETEDPLLILAPFGRDGPVTAEVVRSGGLPAEVLSDFSDLAKLENGSGLILAEEALGCVDLAPIFDWLERQPPWSDYPIVLLRTRNGAVTNATQNSLARLGNVTILERPLHPITLVSAARSAVRARRRQREAEAFLLERLRAADALRESELRFRSLADSAPALIWTTDRSGSWIYANRRHEEIFSTPADAFLGDGWRAVVDPEDRDRVIESFAEAARWGRALQLEYRVRDREGEARWLRSEAAPRFSDGEFVGHVASAIDVTDARAAAEVLERRVEARTEELAAANRRLLDEIAEREKMEATLLKMQRLEAVGQLTAGIAHDFNNLLQVIVGGVSFLQANPESPRAEKRVEMMRLAAERGAMLTRQLLAFSRRQKLAPAAVNLNEAIENLRDLLQGAIGGSVALDIRLTPDPWPALVDPTQIEMIVLNLAINARDAMDVGGRLTVETANVTLERPKTRPEEPEPGDYVMVAVADTGSGMPPEVLQKVFEPFFTTKPVGKGSGLGLSQVLGFASQSGGGVSIETEVGVGTTVKVFLPRATDAHTLPSGSVSEQDGKPLRRGATVLVVDDDELVRETTAQMLTQLGCRALQAGSGGAALDLLAQHPLVDLLIVDFAMPGMNGAEVVRIATSKRPDLSVLVATGYADHTALDGVPKERILTKPFSSEELAARVRAALGDAGEATPVALNAALDG